MNDALRIRPGRANEATRLRAIRLEALLDSPDAFGDTYEECLAWDDATWERYAREWNFYFAELDGEVVGMARGEAHHSRPDSRWLFAMYVAPRARGTDAARGLVDVVSAWAVCEGVDALYLYVSKAVPRAKAFYEKVGFVATGPSLCMSRDANLVCEEMRRDLSDRAFRVEQVPAARLYDLRRRVLREDRADVDVTNPGDDLATSRHYAGVVGDRVVVSASFYAAPAPATVPTAGPTAEPSFQLRYMACDDDLRGKGLGGRVLTHALDDLVRQGARRAWAYARVGARDFYRRAGWSEVDDSLFVSAETGIDHVVIYRDLASTSTLG